MSKKPNPADDLDPRLMKAFGRLGKIYGPADKPEPKKVKAKKATGTKRKVAPKAKATPKMKATPKTKVVSKVARTKAIGTKVAKAKKTKILPKEFELAMETLDKIRSVKKRKGIPERLEKPEDVFIRLYSSLAKQKMEYGYVIGLSKNLEIVSEENISRGSCEMTIVCPRNVFPFPKAKGAAFVIVVHNHPGGSDYEPSPEDLSMKQKIEQAGYALKIPLLDFVIMNEAGFWSDFGSQFINEKYRQRLEEIE